jgi:1,4-alpha-glucan branching enzyme
MIISRWKKNKELIGHAGCMPMLSIVMVSLMLLCQCGGGHYVKSEDQQIPVRFIYVDPEAVEVCVSGSFNNWSAGTHCMVRAGGIWSVSIMLPPGRYSYLLVIDGHLWQEDPGSVLSEDNGFGMNNSVLVVE